MVALFVHPNYYESVGVCRSAGVIYFNGMEVGQWHGSW
jgi:hypothetical protein